ncbi:MAG TPA: cytidine deaminase [Treponemataceae bacterium]|nr:cytidine deaminase [Treponemataceae bacterium]
MKKDLQYLFSVALKASENSYSPYSHFPVGAALLMKDGSIIRGTNVENRSFGVSNCAERTALYTAVTNGYRSIMAIAVATPSSSSPVGPCGVCRQALSEFAPPETPVIFGCSVENQVETTLGDLYPYDSLHELAQGL